MNHSLQVIKTENGKEGTLTLTGDVTMAEVQETKKAILEAINEVDRLFLDLKKIESVDVSFVQLLCAAHRECFVSEKDIFMDAEMGDTIESLLEKAGYMKQCGCFPAARKSCLWATYGHNQ